MTRFDYVAYDDESKAAQANFKAAADKLDTLIEAHLGTSRAASLAITKLEEAYMWIGKAIRDRQYERQATERRSITL